MTIPGSSIGRYRISEQIGEGAMARVYKAYDPDIDRTVALKILKEEHCVDAEQVTRFLREGKAAGALTHPNIVTVHDVGTLQSAPYIMLELLDGSTLREAMASGTRLPLKQVLGIAAQVAAALNYAHENNVVHRDIKPDNIILAPDGESVKIADFGIARLDEAAREATQAGMILGTPRYMSPEQALGHNIDGRSDLFSLGVILYEMLTGHKAFAAQSMATLILQVIQQDPQPIPQLVADVPPGVQTIVSKLLQKKPGRRFQSGQQLLESLERELRLLEDDEAEQSRYVPLQLKWTAIMGAVVAIVMAVSSVLVLRVQSAALQQQAIDSGLSLARFVARQAAVPVLGEDWITLGTFVDDASARASFDYLLVIDHQGVVRSATDKSLEGKTHIPRASGEILYQRDDAQVRRLQSREGGQVFNFYLPVYFDSTQVGTLELGLDQDRLNGALDTSRRLLTALAFVLVAAVLVVIYVFNKVVARNLLLATRALQIFGRGKLESRISKQRADEFGELFSAFNSMAEEVQRRVESAEDDTAAVAPPEQLSAAEKALDISGISHGIVEEHTLMGQDKGPGRS